MTRHYLHVVLDDLTDDHIATIVPAIEERTIAQLALHSMGSCLAAVRMISGQAGQHSARPVPSTMAELQLALDQLANGAIAAANELPLSAWTDTHALPFPRPGDGSRTATGYEVMLLMLSHAQRHIGAIQAIRSVSGFPTQALG